MPSGTWWFTTANATGDEQVLAGSTYVWTNPQKVLLEMIDGYASVVLSPNYNYTRYLRATANAGMGTDVIPTGSTVTGLAAMIVGHADSMRVMDHSIKLHDNGTPVGAEMATEDHWPYPESTNVVIGGDGNLWGLTAGDLLTLLTKAGFGILISLQQDVFSVSSSTAAVYSVELQVFYALDSGASAAVTGATNISATCLATYMGAASVTGSCAIVASGGGVVYGSADVRCGSSFGPGDVPDGVVVVKTASAAVPGVSSLISYAVESRTGTYVSSSYALGAVGVVTLSSISWVASAPDGSSVRVEARLGSGDPWHLATNGGAVPGVVPGMTLDGKSLEVRVTLYGWDGVIPTVRDLKVSIISEGDVRRVLDVSPSPDGWVSVNLSRVYTPSIATGTIVAPPVDPAPPDPGATPPAPINLVLSSRDAQGDGYLTLIDAVWTGIEWPFFDHYQLSYFWTDPVTGSQGWSVTSTAPSASFICPLKGVPISVEVRSVTTDGVVSAPLTGTITVSAAQVVEITAGASGAWRLSAPMQMYGNQYIFDSCRIYNLDVNISDPGHLVRSVELFQNGGFLTSVDYAGGPGAVQFKLRSGNRWLALPELPHNDNSAVPANVNWGSDAFTALAVCVSGQKVTMVGMPWTYGMFSEGSPASDCNFDPGVPMITHPTRNGCIMPALPTSPVRGDFLSQDNIGPIYQRLLSGWGTIPAGSTGVNISAPMPRGDYVVSVTPKESIYNLKVHYIGVTGFTVTRENVNLQTEVYFCWIAVLKTEF